MIFTLQTHCAIDLITSIRRFFYLKNPDFRSRYYWSVKKHVPVSNDKNFDDYEAYYEVNLDLSENNTTVSENESEKECKPGETSKQNSFDAILV